MSAIELRPYQREAIDAVHAAIARGVTRPAVVLPTGAGKTVVFAHPDFRAPIKGRGRMLVIAHRDELITQAMGKIRASDPLANVGRVQAGYDETDRDIIVSSVQTLARASRRTRIRDVSLIVVDEAHHATARTYVETLRHFGAFRGVPTVGFSATLERADDGKLGDIWQEVVTCVDVIDGIRQGWLVDVHGKRVAIEGLDLATVKRSHGDYSERDLGERLEAADAPEQVAEAYVEVAKDRQGIAFWPTVDVALSGSEAFDDAGVRSAVVTGSTPTDERALIYDAYRRGELQMISSVMVLTEGFDMPQASAAVIARPTRSASLYVQMSGRVLRPWHLPVPGYRIKRDALIIDAVGASAEHSLATLADLSTTLKVAPDEDVSLVEAADEALGEEERTAAVMAGEIDPVTGRRVIRDVDLFGDRRSMWLRTPAGTWFVPAGDWLVFLWPDDSAPGLWVVGGIVSKGARGGAQLLETGLTLDWAMQRAEVYARQAVAALGKGALDTRKAGWRRGSASPAQLSYARSLGCRLPDRGMLSSPSRGEVSDAISVALASRVLGG